MKKIIAVLLVLVMTVLSVPLVFATEHKEGGFVYEVNGDGAIITHYIGDDIDVVFPDTLGGYPVVEIEDIKGGNKNNIRSIKIPESVTRIGYQAFQGCENLRYVEMPDTAIVIKSDAFRGCKNLLHINLPREVSFEYKNMFSDCLNLKYIELPDSPTHLESLVCGCVNLRGIFIPRTLKSIEVDEAFYGCPYYTDIYYEGTEEEWNEFVIARDDGVFSKATVHFNSERIEHKIETVNGCEATCTEDGFTKSVVCTGCDMVLIESEIIPAKGHTDKDSNGYCDTCKNKLILNEPEDSETPSNPSESCDCNCHKSGFMGFMGFIWKILTIFYKLFRINPVCSCGIAHY